MQMRVVGVRNDPVLNRQMADQMIIRLQPPRTFTTVTTTTVGGAMLFEDVVINEEVTVAVVEEDAMIMAEGAGTFEVEEVVAVVIEVEEGAISQVSC